MSTKPVAKNVSKPAAVTALRRFALVALAGTVFASTGSTVAEAARRPTPRERGAIEQAMFDYYRRTHLSPAHAVIRKIRISTRASRRSRQKVAAYYSGFARVDLFDSTASGPGAALLGYRRGSLPGWRVLDIGSVAVGCLPARIFGGRRAAVLRDLKLECP